MIKTTITPPPAVAEIARTLEKAGFETWCVGGGVRDAVLGQKSLDWDLATAATPEQVRKLFRRTIPIGIAFGTVAVVDADGVNHEVTTFRRDVRTDGRHAVVEFGASLDEDLGRRDFTINALAYSPTKRKLHDPFDGLGDLERRIVRAVGEPAERMREDRLRALRAFRFAARYDFTIDPATWEAVAASAPELRRLSAERVKQEIEKTMEQIRFPGRAFAMWRDAGALDVLVPAIARIDATGLAALDALPQPRQAGHTRRRMLRLMALFSAADPERLPGALHDLRFANADNRWISDTIQRWAALDQRMTEVMLQRDPPSRAELRRWAARAGRTRLAYVLRLAAAYWCARRSLGQAAPESTAVASAYRRALRIAYNDPIEIADLAVDGTDLEKLGLAGPVLGRMLQRLLAQVIEDPSVNTVARLTEIARRTAAERSAANSS